MNKRKIYFIGLLFVVMALGSPVFIFAAEETSTMMCDEGVVNIGDADADVRKNAANPTASRWTSGSIISAPPNISP